jgi:hypothetical protein
VKNSTNLAWIKAKGFLFLFLGRLSAALLFFEHPHNPAKHRRLPPNGGRPDLKLTRQGGLRMVFRNRITEIVHPGSKVTEFWPQSQRKKSHA